MQYNLTTCKTYWKSPGDGGFAQSISWENSTNVKKVNILWPTPIEFEILGLTSLGYQNDIIFPLERELEDELKDTFLNLHITCLICKEICRNESVTTNSICQKFSQIQYSISRR